MRRIKCDVCGKDVNVNDNTEMPWSGYVFNEVSLLKREVAPKQYDLCYQCSEKVNQFICEKIAEDACKPKLKKIVSDGD